MFKIDLLKGQAIPLKSKPGGLVILAVTGLVPIAVAMGMFSLYQNNKIAVSVKEKEIARCDTEIVKLSDAVELQRALENEIITYGKCLSEVKSSLGKHTQWSPILTTLMENIPDSVVLTSLGVEHDSVERRVPKPDNPKKMVPISVAVRTLQLGVSGGPQSNCQEAVKDFMDRLRSSAFLGPKLEKITPSRKDETIEGQDVISYEINCVFKPGL
jgi:Tfp pilus assembly protein PilN